MQNKGQITLFIILGFVIVVGVGFIYYISSITMREKTKIEAEKFTQISFSLDNIKNLLNVCFKDLAAEGVDYVSERGGYFNLPKYSYGNGIINSAYYFYEDRSLFPKLEVLENSISEYIKIYTNYCFENLKNTTDIFDVNYYINNVSTKILQSNLIININIPTKIKSSDLTFEINNFKIQFENNRLYDIFNFNEYLVNKQLEDKYSICLSCIINKGIEYNFFTNIDNVGDNILLFTIRYNDTKTNTLKKFIFANKYKQISCNNLPIDADEDFLILLTEDCAQQEIEKFNYSFNVEDIGNLFAYVGVPFTTRVKASGHNLEFISYTDLFDIDSKSGTINFIPTEEQLGEHIVLIQIIDAFGNKDLKTLNITIKNQDEN